MTEPTEDQEQRLIFQWKELQLKLIPELKLLHSSLNGVKLTIGQGKKAKSLGMVKGVPDICWPIQRAGYAGLFLELKRIKSGRLSPEQKEWLSELKKQGYFAVCVRGGRKAIDIIKAYARGDEKELLSLIE